jgi:hypothetical protein
VGPRRPCALLREASDGPRKASVSVQIVTCPDSGQFHTKSEGRSGVPRAGDKNQPVPRFVYPAEGPGALQPKAP